MSVSAAGTEDQTEGAPARYQKDSSMLARGLALVSAFRDTPGELSLAELCRRTGLPKPTAHRLVRDLIGGGFLDRGTHGYRPGRELFLLGQSEQGFATVRDLALPQLARLFAATEENAMLVVRGGADALVLDVISGRRSVPLPHRAGARLPMNRTAFGEVLVGGPPAPHGARQRAGAERGYAVRSGDLVVGAVSVAVPVQVNGTRPPAAIGVTGRFGPQLVDRVLPLLRDLASMFAQDLTRAATRSEALADAITLLTRPVPAPLENVS